MSALRGYLLCYDITEPKRLRRMHKLAKAFGRPLQFSVFVCVLRREDRVKLSARVDALIQHRSDRVVILDLGTVQDRDSWIPPLEVFGVQHIPSEPSSIIV